MEKNNLILNLISFLKNDIIQKNDFYLMIFNRNLKISKSMIGLKIALHNGKYFIPLKISKNMVGKIIGSFSFSKNIFLFDKDLNRFNKKKKEKREGKKKNKK